MNVETTEVVVCCPVMSRSELYSDPTVCTEAAQNSTVRHPPELMTHRAVPYSPGLILSRSPF